MLRRTRSMTESIAAGPQRARRDAAAAAALAASVLALFLSNGVRSQGSARRSSYTSLAGAPALKKAAARFASASIAIQSRSAIIAEVAI
jgi:hypothetical protein